MKYLKYFESNNTDFEKDGIKIENQQFFNRFIISTKNYNGKGKRIIFDSKSYKITRGDFKDGFGNELLKFLDENKNEISNLYGSSFYDRLYDEVKDKTNKPIKTYKLAEYGNLVAVTTRDGNHISMPALQLKIYDDMVKIICDDTGLLITKNSIYLIGYLPDNLECFLLGHYTKGLSKYAPNVRYSKNLYNILKKYAPDYLPTLVDIDFIESYGWRHTNDSNFKIGNDYWGLHDFNIVRFDKGDRILLFDFNHNIAEFYTSKPELIEKVQAVNNKEMEELKSKLKK